MKQREEKTPVYECVAEEGGFAVHRNGRYLMTPKGNAFHAAQRGLIEAIVQEWQAQGEKINAAQMPLTQLMATAFDIVAKDREKIIGGLLAYITSELLCHQVDEPPVLVAKQKELWQPVIDWCGKRYDVRFAVGHGIMPIAQSSEVERRLRVVLEAHDNLWLAGLSSATDSSGSLILGLAIAEQERDAESVFLASELDVMHQAIKWGDDPVTIARQHTVKFDLKACELWFNLLKA